MQTTDRKYPLILMALAILTAAIAPVAPGILWFNVIAGAESTNLLNHVVTHAGFDQSQKSEIEFIDRDGPMPEMSRQRLGISGDATDATSAISALTRACHDMGLRVPDAGQSATEPDMICSGTFDGARVTVHATALCEVACDIAIETRAF